MKGSRKTLEVSFTKSRGKKLLENISLATNTFRRRKGEHPVK